MTLAATLDELRDLIVDGQRALLRARRPDAPPAQAPRWNVRAEAPTAPAHVYLYDVIGWPGIDAAGVVADLRALNGRDVVVHVNSPGGNVFDGLAIFNALRQHAGDVAVHVDGLAASIASIVAMGGRRLTMAAASFLMIHEPHALVIGDAHDMRHMASLLDKTAGVMADVYAKRGPDRAAVRKWMHDETWFSARDAFDARLIDEVDDEAIPADALAARAAFDTSGFRRPPVFAAPVKPTPRAREHARLVAQGFALLAGDRPAA